MADNTLYDRLLEIVKKRRNNRKFRSDPVPEGTIEKIIEVARWAPSGFHTQPWEFVAVTDKEIRDRIESSISSRLVDPKISIPFNITAPDYRGDLRPSHRRTPRGGRK